MPGGNPLETAQLIFDELPDLPFLAELPGRGPGADMIGRAAALLVDIAVELTPGGWRIADHPGLDMRRASEVDARKVQCPLLFLTGSGDRISPPGTVERTAALYKDRARCEIMPGMSHWLIAEPGWEKVCDRSLAWLASI